MSIPMAPREITVYPPGWPHEAGANVPRRSDSVIAYLERKPLHFGGLPS